VPLGGVRIGGIWIGIVPVLAMLLCWSMMVPVVLDIGGQALNGHPVPALILGCYLIAGALVYLLYGARRSLVGREAGQ
jgi:APA family basic amino acid/polyamine antiporter